MVDEVPGLQNGAHVLRLSVPVILTTLAEFQLKVLADHSHNLILDFTDVPYVDSAGIGILVRVYLRHQRDECGLSLVGVNSRVRAALEIAHIDRFFRFFDNLEVAQANHIPS